MPARRSSSDAIVWKEVDVESAMVGGGGGVDVRLASMEASGLYGAGEGLHGVGASGTSAVGQVGH
jgi:hypothetical protein